MSLVITPKRWATKPPLGAQIMAGHPSARGLAAAFILNEGSGSVYDLANRGSAGVITGSPAWSPGIFGLQIGSFTTGSGYIDFGTDSATQDLAKDTSDFSLVAWVSNDGGVIAGRNDANTVDAGWVFGSTGNNAAFKLLVEHSGSNATIQANNFSLTSPANTPTQCAVTYPGASESSALIYQNGIALSTSVVAGSGARGTDSANPFRIGDYPAYRGGLSGAWTGQVMMLLIFRRVLSAGEIARLYIDPFCFVQPQSPQRRYWVTTGAAPVSTDPPFGFLSQPSSHYRPDILTV